MPKYRVDAPGIGYQGCRVSATEYGCRVSARVTSGCITQNAIQITQTISNLYLTKGVLPGHLPVCLLFEIRLRHAIGI